MVFSIFIIIIMSDRFAVDFPLLYLLLCQIYIHINTSRKYIYSQTHCRKSSNTSRWKVEQNWLPTNCLPFSFCTTLTWPRDDDDDERALRHTPERYRARQPFANSPRAQLHRIVAADVSQEKKKLWLHYFFFSEALFLRLDFITTGVFYDEMYF